MGKKNLEEGARMTGLFKKKDCAKIENEEAGVSKEE